MFITIPLKTAYTNGLPDDEHTMFETCGKTPSTELKLSFNKYAFCWLTLHNCITTHGTNKHKVIHSYWFACASHHICASSCDCELREATGNVICVHAT